MADWPLRGDGQRAENAGANGADSAAVTVTTGGSTDTKGSYSELIASTAFDAAGFFLSFTSVEATERFLIDISIGAAGSEEIILADVIYALRVTHSANIGLWVPHSIPSGTRVSCRGQATNANETFDALVVLIGVSALPSAAFNRGETAGADTVNSIGTDVDPGGVANTKGSWVEIIASTAFDYREMIVAVGNSDDFGKGSNDSVLVDVGVGAAGSEEVILPDMLFGQGTTLDGLSPPSVGPVPIHVPSGSRLAARAQSSGTNANDRIIDVLMHGFG